MSKLDRRLVVPALIASLLLVGAPATLAQESEESPLNYTGCLKANGKLKKLIRGVNPVRRCKVRETEIHLASEDTTNIILNSLDTVIELAETAEDRFEELEADVDNLNEQVDGKILVDGTFRNTALGAQAFPSEELIDNTAIGAHALENLEIPGQGNTAVGSFALRITRGGFFNTAIGHQALQLLQTDTPDPDNPNNARDNIAVGRLAGSQLRAGRFNIYVGNTGQNSENGVIRIGDTPFQNSVFIAGIAGTVLDGQPVLVAGNGQLGVGMSSRTYKKKIEPMGARSDDLMRLRPVSFRYREPNDKGNYPLQYGLIAEEVAEVYPELVGYSADGKPQTVSYHKLNSMLLNELQKQHTQLAQQEQLIAELTARLARVEAGMTHP